MTVSPTFTALTERFPLGTKVLNFGVKAEVVGYNDHGGLMFHLELAERNANGKLRRSHWLADPAKCEII